MFPKMGIVDYHDRQNSMVEE
jgi:hypothetical protein